MIITAVIVFVSAFRDMIHLIDVYIESTAQHPRVLRSLESRVDWIFSAVADRMLTSTSGGIILAPLVLGKQKLAVFLCYKHAVIFVL